jgi:hypothetical protein
MLLMSRGEIYPQGEEEICGADRNQSSVEFKLHLGKLDITGS